MNVLCIRDWKEDGMIKYHADKRYDLEIDVDSYPYYDYFVAISCDTCVNCKPHPLTGGNSYDFAMRSCSRPREHVPIRSMEWECPDWEFNKSILEIAPDKRKPFVSLEEYIQRMNTCYTIRSFPIRECPYNGLAYNSYPSAIEAIGIMGKQIDQMEKDGNTWIKIPE